jgi:RNA polymerase sigma-70 factor (ECF subfamily)
MTLMSSGPQPHPSEWRAFRHRLLGYVRRRINDPAEAEDLVQDVLARAADRLPSLRSGEQLLPWLHSISRNALVDFYRRQGRAPMLVPLDSRHDDLPSVGEPDGERNRAALAACVRPMVHALPAIYREAVARVDLEGERQVDVARDLGLSISALKSRVQRGRVLLRQAFTDCCGFERDAAGRVVAYHPKGSSCIVMEQARCRR